MPLHAALLIPVRRFSGFGSNPTVGYQFPSDSPFRFLDTCHTVCIWTSLWNYLIDHFGDTARIHYIPT